MSVKLRNRDQSTIIKRILHKKNPFQRAEHLKLARNEKNNFQKSFLILFNCAEVHILFMRVIVQLHTFDVHKTGAMTLYNLDYL